MYIENGDILRFKGYFFCTSNEKNSFFKKGDIATIVSHEITCHLSSVVIIDYTISFCCEGFLYKTEKIKYQQFIETFEKII